MPTIHGNNDSHLLTVAEVARLLHCSPRHINRLVAGGGFPAPITLGLRLKRWSRPKVENWITEQIAESR